MPKIFYPPAKPIQGKDGRDGSNPTISEILPDNNYVNGAIKISYLNNEYVIPKPSSESGIVYPLAAVKNFSSNTKSTLLNYIYIPQDLPVQKNFNAEFIGGCYCTDNATIDINIYVYVNDKLKVTKTLSFNKIGDFKKDTLNILATEIDGNIMIIARARVENVSSGNPGIINSLFMKQK
jgi:hypothetical protein